MWWLGPVIGAVVCGLALEWALRAHRRERRPWLDLLSRSVDGVATDAGGTLPAIRAPFSGRPCLGYVIDVVVQESFLNRTTSQRVHRDGAGRLLLVAIDGSPRAEIDLTRAQPLFPSSPESYAKPSMPVETVFQGPMERAPAHLVSFVQTLAPSVQRLLWRPNANVYGKRVHFNERVVVPGQSIVAVDGFLGFGTIDAERRRISKLPMAGELFGAIAGGLVALGVVEAIVSVVNK